MSILSEAEALVHGERQNQYGDPVSHFGLIADMWSSIIGADVSPRDVALCMMSTKLVRESFRPHRDNRVDLAGYLLITDMLTDAAEIENDG